MEHISNSYRESPIPKNPRTNRSFLSHVKCKPQYKISNKLCSFNIRLPSLCTEYDSVVPNNCKPLTTSTSYNNKDVLYGIKSPIADFIDNSANIFIKDKNRKNMLRVLNKFFRIHKSNNNELKGDYKSKESIASELSKSLLKNPYNNGWQSWKRRCKADRNLNSIKNRYNYCTQIVPELDYKKFNTYLPKHSPKGKSNKYIFSPKLNSKGNFNKESCSQEKVFPITDSQSLKIGNTKTHAQARKLIKLLSGSLIDNTKKEIQRTTVIPL